VRTVIAGYHWFHDWGRDTMISLKGLTLTTGRHAEAATSCAPSPLHSRWADPEPVSRGEREGCTTPPTPRCWFFHALDRYLAFTHDRGTLRLLLPSCWTSSSNHRRGTRFGIRVDPEDGLLRQGQERYQTHVDGLPRSAIGW